MKMQATETLEQLVAQVALHFDSHCQLDGEGHCITCSDQALQAKVIQVDLVLALAQVEIAGAVTEVDISLVDAIAPGDLLLVHGGVALAQVINSAERRQCMARNLTNAPVAPATVPPRAVLREHPIEVALFNNTGPITLLWLVIRVWLGAQWAIHGWEKVNSPQWMDGTKIIGFWQGSLAEYGKPNSDVAYDWYSTFLKTLLDSGSHTWFAPLVAWGELLGGVALILGLFTGLVAFLLAFMNFNYMLAGSAGINPVFLLLALLLVVAWKIAGWWGLDRFVLPALGPPGHPGSLFRRRASEANMQRRS